MKKDFEVNNAAQVVEQYEVCSQQSPRGYLTLVQGNTYSGVRINKESSKNNSIFIVRHWHDRNN